MTWSPLAEFKPQYIPKSYAFKIQRAILRRAWVPRMEQKHPVLQTRRILQKHRRRITELVRFCPRLRKEPSHIRYLLNCPPTMFVPIPKHRLKPCNRRLICPWCYSRWVREVWELFEAVLFSESKQANCSVVFNVPVDDLLSGERAVVDWLDRAIQDLKRPDVNGCVGHISWIQMYPALPNIRAKRMVLALTTDHRPLRGKLVLPTKATLAKFFVDVFALPRKIAAGPIGQLSQIYEWQHGKRLFERYGLLRAALPARKRRHVSEDSTAADSGE